MDIKEAIQSRRSIFPSLFTGEQIDDAVVVELLNRANQAPSHKKTEPWRFKVVKSEGLDRLAAFFQKTYKNHVTAESYSSIKFRKLRSKVEKSSHILILSMQTHPDKGVPEWEELAATACALQNLWLSCASLGVGGYWSSPAIMIHHIQEFVEMNEDEQCLGFFYLGVPKSDLIIEERNKNIDQKVSWIDK